MQAARRRCRPCRGRAERLRSRRGARRRRTGRWARTAAGVDLGAAGQLVLAAAVGAHRPDVAGADEGDLAPVGGEIRFAVGRVFGELVEVPVFGGEEAAFGLGVDFAALRFFDGGDRPREDDGAGVSRRRRRWRPAEPGPEDQDGEVK